MSRTAIAIAAWGLAAALTLRIHAQADFVRGDANDDGGVDLSDAVCALESLFQAEPGRPCARPACLDALDVNDDERADISDPISLLNFLFLGAAAPPEPFAGGCGPDPGPAGPLGCDDFASCEPSFVLDTPAGMKLFAIWSEAYTTPDAMHAVISVLRLKPGRLRVRAGADTTDLDWIESLELGPRLAPAEPLEPGLFRHNPGQEYSHEYTQRFRTAAGDWKLVLRVDARGWTSKAADCAFFDGPEAALRNPVFWAEIELPAGLRFIQYSCFLDGEWMPSGQSPIRFELEDGARAEVRVDQAYLFRGAAGETANQRVRSAAVDIGGARIEVDAYDRLIYAARHHNASQGYRVLFAEPVDGVYGLDLLTCPETEPGCGFTFGLKGSRAFYLGADFARAREVKVTAATAGE